MLKKMGLQPGDASDREEAAKRKLLDTVLPTAKVNLQPQIFVVTAKGRLKAEVKKYSPPVSEMSAKDLALLKVDGDSFPVLPLADSRGVQVGDPVHILGFPGVVLTHELLSKSTMVDSVVTNGAVSAIQADASNNPLIQTDASAAWGNSGGPTVDDRGKVVGVLTFVSLAPGAEGAIVQGFNFVIPSAAVTDFVRGTPVKVNGPSKFNDVWYAGLTAFYAEDYPGALRRFEEADKLHPNLPDVRRKLVETREYVKNPPPKPFPWFWVAVGVTLVSAGGFGGQWLHRWNKNRYRVHPFEVVRMIEGGKSPTILDARKSDAYEQLPLKIPGSVRVVPEDLPNSMAGLDLDPARPGDRLLLLPGRGDQRPGGPRPAQDGLQGRADPEGRHRRLDQRGAADRDPLGSLAGRARALQGPGRRQRLRRAGPPATTPHPALSPEGRGRLRRRGPQ